VRAHCLFNFYIKAASVLVVSQGRIFDYTGTENICQLGFGNIPRKISNYLMEVRGLEPLTSGLQSPRSAKLSYTPLKSQIEDLRFEIVGGPE
jgi:hypothetical protein